MDIHEINLDGSEQKICRECIDDLRMGGKFEKSKMMQDSTVYRIDELEEDEEEVEGTVDFDGGDKVNYVPFVYPRGTVSVSSLGPFCMLVLLLNLSILLCLSLLDHITFKSISRGRGGENENLLSHSRRRPGRRSG